MATNNLTIRKGQCINFGNCNKANAKEIIEINIGDEFVCPNPECGGVLVELPPWKFPWLLIIAGILAVLGVGGFFAYKLVAGGNKASKDDKTKQVIEYPITPDGISLDQTTLSFAKAGETAQLSVTVFPENAKNKTVIWQSGDVSVASVSETGLVTAVAKGNVVISAYTGNGFSDTCNVTVEAPPIDDIATFLANGTLQSGSDGTGKISTEYGNYTGDLKDGKAHGNGVFQVFKRVRISQHDERIAEEGDYLVGQYVNNEVLQTKWFDKDKQQKGTIIIGRKGVE